MAMKYTDEQIYQMYRDKCLDHKMDISEFIETQAKINECAPSYIRAILSKHGVKTLPPEFIETPEEQSETIKGAVEEIKKRGRKPETEDDKLVKAAKKIKALQEIPASLEILVTERMESLRIENEIHERAINHNKKELAELEEFMNGKTIRSV